MVLQNKDPNWVPPTSPHQERLKSILEKKGLKVKSNYPIFGFYPDLWIVGSWLLIEVDGLYHREVRSHDTWRTLALNRYGFEVVRVRNDEIDNNLRNVLRRIEWRLFECNKRKQQPKLMADGRIEAKKVNGRTAKERQTTAKKKQEKAVKSGKPEIIQIKPLTPEQTMFVHAKYNKKKLRREQGC